MLGLPELGATTGLAALEHLGLAQLGLDRMLLNVPEWTTRWLPSGTGRKLQDWKAGSTCTLDLDRNLG